MRTIQIGNETLRLSASSERAIRIFDDNHGCAMTSEFSTRSYRDYRGRWNHRNEVDPSLGIDIEQYHLCLDKTRRRDLEKLPHWVRQAADRHPRAQTLLFV